MLSHPPPTSQGVTLNFSADKIIGNGSFGIVFEATIAETGETVAIKKVLQDKRFKVRHNTATGPAGVVQMWDVLSPSPRPCFRIESCKS